ncbi:hypothetical protein FIU89_07745 [Roseovarius sp. THAF27]|uniref:hypothetical protein n=1 Tax=unclassified Roseovarius TaxID=2614913 RepID=UPI0012685623|nr:MULTISPECIES: hypothetical protein [unclassified Roseovarius]QFT80500.1 hypothetical protein FIU89_07745 [Roseovarius sp. THAF27]QFT96372.1 hypothetical protein FIU85_03570 [Roseovarius sp. THAF8]
MSDQEQWQQRRGYGMPVHDAGSAGLFWVLVVVVALGALVFAGSLGNGTAPDLSDVPEGFIVPDTSADGVAGTAAVEE